MKQKSKQTCLKKYGVDNPTKSPYFIQKAIITRIKRQGDLFLPNIGKHEQHILNEMEILDKCKIERKFKCLPYYPDGYCKETNTIYEVYERFHKKPKNIKKDLKRQSYIQEKLKCNFVIIWDLKNQEPIIERYPYNTQEDLYIHYIRTHPIFLGMLGTQNMKCHYTSLFLHYNMTKKIYKYLPHIYLQYA